MGRSGKADMKKTCERCNNCYKEYMIGGYATPASTSKRYFIYSKNIDKLFADIPE